MRDHLIILAKCIAVIVIIALIIAICSTNTGQKILGGCILFGLLYMVVALIHFGDRNENTDANDDMDI